MAPLPHLRRALAALALVTAATAAAAQDRWTYTVSGTNLDGSPYSGEAEIVLTSDTTCAIRWITGGGAESYGICMVKGDQLIAGYQMGDGVGLAVYDLREDGSLDGVWVVSGQDGSGTERLIPAR